MSVLNRLKAMVKEAQEDIDNSQKRRVKSKPSNDEKALEPDTQTSSHDDRVEKIQKYRKSVSNSKITEKPSKNKVKSVDMEVSLEKKENHTVEFKKSLEIKVEEKPEEKVKIKDTDETSETNEIVEDVKIESEDINTSEDNEEVLDIVKEETTEVEESETTNKEENENSKEKNKKSDNMTLLNENDVYTMDDIDAEFHQKFLDAGVITVDHCFQCGTCGGGCPSGRRTPYRVRKLVRNCLLGLKDEVISDDTLWMCTTCYTCQERCPRGVKIVDVVKEARRIASHAGYMAKAHKMTGVFVINTGHGVPINDATKELRKNIGLPELPPTTHSFPEALKEVQGICKECGFDELIGYDEATGGLKE